MKYLRYPWSVYCLLVFVLTLLIATPVYLLIFLVKGKEGGRLAHRVSRTWAMSLVTICLVRIKVHNRHLIDLDRTYVIVANHASQLDIPVCALSTDHYMKFLSKEELTRVPLLGYIIKNLYITVSRKSRDDRARSLEKMRQAISNGISVMIYPEGTRNRTDEPLKSFYDGAFKTAIKSGAEIAILTIKGSSYLLPIKPKFFMAPGTIHCYWDVPLRTKGMTFKDIPRLKQDVRERMLSHLVDQD